LGGSKTEPVKTLRRQLLLRVHPDLFQAPHHEHARVANQRSLQAFQSLYVLSGFSSAPSSSAALPAVDSSMPLLSFHFFFFHDSTLPSTESPSGGTLEPDRGQLRELRHDFNPPPDIRRQPARLRRAAQDCMVRLFTLAGLILPRPSPNPSELPDGWVWSDWSKRNVKDQLVGLLRSAPGDVKLSAREELMALLDPDMIFFNRLSTAQKSRALYALTTNLRQLGYDEWAHIPLLIGAQYSRQAEGIVMIPYNFTIPRMVAYLNQHLPEIKREREKIHYEARLIADLSHRLQQRLELKDLAIWGTKRTAIASLQRLADLVPRLASCEHLASASIILTDCIPALQEADWEEATANPSPSKDGKQESMKEFWYDPRARRFFVRKDFEKAALLAFLENVGIRRIPGTTSEPQPAQLTALPRE